MILPADRVPRGEDAVSRFFLGINTLSASEPGQGILLRPPGTPPTEERGEGMVWTTIPALAREGHVGVDRLYELAAREVDPLPLRFVDGARYGQVLVSEFEAWVKRNSVTYAERKSNG